LKPRILYVVYWGAAEPLGRSLVVPAACRLAELGTSVTLVTFEKPADLARQPELESLRGRLVKSGVRWTPLRYHKSPKWPATAFDMMRGVGRGIWERLLGSIDVVHARTFVAGPIGLGVARMLGARFVYHNEGFYPDEQVDGGVWAAGSLPHRFATALERQLYARADANIVLSHRAAQQVSPLGRNSAPVLVVPSAVDLDRFRLGPGRGTWLERPLRLAYVGSVGLRYLLDRVGRFVSILASRAPTRLRVLSGAPEALVAELLNRGGLSRELWTAAFVPHETMPNELQQCDAGLFFLTQGLSEHGCSPTKFGEYWASGLPVVTTPNVSDSEDIIRKERVGVIVRGHSDEAYRLAGEELLALLQDPELANRCRRAAETHYSLERACQDQLALYRRVCGHAPAVSDAA